MELEHVIDFRTFTRLRRIKNKAKINKINQLDEEKRVLALKKYFANTNAYGMQTAMIADWLGNMQKPVSSQSSNSSSKSK